MKKYQTVITLYILFLIINIWNIHSITNISGIIQTDCIWTKENGPYIITNDTSISAGIILTIEAGTIIKFNSPSIQMIINGSVIALGSSEEFIIFTSIKDDTVGGDDNGDGDTSFPRYGDWNKIQINSGGVIDFQYTIVRYAGFYGGNSSNQYAILNNAGNVIVNNCNINDK